MESEWSHWISFSSNAYWYRTQTESLSIEPLDNPPPPPLSQWVGKPSIQTAVNLKLEGECVYGGRGGGEESLVAKSLRP